MAYPHLNAAWTDFYRFLRHRLKMPAGADLGNLVAEPPAGQRMQ